MTKGGSDVTDDAATITLTDDELLALSPHGLDGWLPGLPTVETTDDDAAATARFRGQRSLAARGLLPGVAGAAPDAAAVALRARQAGHRVEVFLADAALNRVSWVRSSFHYRPTAGDDGPWLVHQVLPVGLHIFGSLAGPAQIEHLTGLLDAAQERGPTASTGEGPETWLSVVSLTPQARSVVLARGGELRGVADAYASSGPELYGASRPLTTADAISLVLDPARSREIVG